MVSPKSCPSLRDPQRFRQPSEAKPSVLLQSASKSFAVVLLCAASAGCQFISAVDRSSLGETGGSSPTGPTGVGGIFLGAGGTSGSGGTNDASGSVELDASGIGGNDDGAAIGAGGAGGTGGATMGIGGIPTTDAGMAGSGGTAGSTQVSDAGTDSPSTSACVRALPAGWVLAAFSPTATACPSGFADHSVLSGSATFGATACTCGCSVTLDGTCQGTLSVSIAPGQGVDTCVNALASGATVNGSNCIQAAAARVENAQTTFTGGGQGGTCMDSPGSNPAQLTKPPAQHFCDVPPSSSDAVCNGTPPIGFSACIVGSANLTCPAPFTRVRYLVEDDMVLACSACTSCNVTTNCSGGTLNLFSDGSCATSVGSVAANGACNSLATGNEVAVGSIQYAATANSTCAGGRSTPSATLVGPRTICCR